MTYIQIIFIVFLLFFKTLETFANNTTVIQYPNGITETVVRFPGTAVEEVVENSIGNNVPVVNEVRSQAISIENRASELRAANPGMSQEQALAAAQESVNSEGGTTKVIVTEKIPGAKCTCITTDVSGQYGTAPGSQQSNILSNQEEGMVDTNCGNPQTRKYSCEVGKGLSGFQAMFQEIVRWVVYISMLLGVFAIAGAGILWTWGSDSEEYTKKAKGWVMNILIGLIILFTFRYILGFLAPWIFQ